MVLPPAPTAKHVTQPIPYHLQMFTTTSTTDKVNATPPLMEEQMDTLWLMQRTDAFCKCISKRSLSGKAPCMKLTHLHALKVSFTSMVWPQIKKFLALVIPKSWHLTVLVEAHDKLGHQGINRTYHLVKHHCHWAGIKKDICKYIYNYTLCKREKARTQVYPLQMTDIPDRPFDKIAIDLVSDLNIRESTHTIYH